MTLIILPDFALLVFRQGKWFQTVPAELLRISIQTQHCFVYE